MIMGTVIVDKEGKRVVVVDLTGSRLIETSGNVCCNLPTPISLEIERLILEELENHI